MRQPSLRMMSHVHQEPWPLERFTLVEARESRTTWMQHSSVSSWADLDKDTDVNVHLELEPGRRHGPMTLHHDMTEKTGMGGAETLPESWLSPGLPRELVVPGSPQGAGCA